jgi:hypothetical protein
MGATNGFLKLPGNLFIIAGGLRKKVPYSSHAALVQLILALTQF